MEFGISTRSRLRRLHLFDHLAQFLQSNILDLAYSLASDSKLLANFLERLLWPAIEPE